MIYLFSNEGLKLLKELCLKKTFFAFDFDGTLAPIVSSHNQAKLNKTTIKLLKTLNQLAHIGVISGRGLSDLKLRLPLIKADLIGNHGLESSCELQNSKVFCELCKNWKRQLQGCFNEVSGIEIEDKNYSLTIHYRNSEQAHQAKNTILKQVKKLHPSPRIMAGKYVINLLPQGALNKGESLLNLLDKLHVKMAFYIGDDDTDEDVFILKNSKLFTVRVGKKEKSKAMFYIQRQNQINLLLKTMISILEKNMLSCLPKK